MPTKLRLGLSLSSIRRVFGPSDEGNRLLTQALENLTSQNGEFIVQQSETITGGFQIGDALLTQSGDFIALNQNIFQILIANHDAVEDEAVADEILDLLLSQANEVLITQDDKNIAVNKSNIVDLLSAQDGKTITTQDNRNLELEQDLDALEALTADLILTQDGRLLTSQDGENIALEQDEKILGDLITAQDGSFLLTQDGDELITEQAS